MADELRRVRPQLVERCSEALLKAFLDYLLHERVLNDLEKESIEEGKTVRADKCRSLIDTVIRKGDYSCNLLLNQIKVKDPMLTEELRLTAASLPMKEKKEEESFQEIKEITLCLPAEYEEITNNKIERYPIYDKATRKRWALIICNVTFNEGNLKERTGANVDLDGMRKLLEGLGYSVQWKMNLTAEEMLTTMKTFAVRTDHSRSDSTFLVFMSHGERDIICGTDFKTEYIEGKKVVTGGLHVDKVIDTFNNENCPGLRDKPKMIIIQACRGNDKGQVWVSDGAPQPPKIEEEDLEDDAFYKTLKERDFICFYSTTPATVSFRDPSKGSLLFQNLIPIMKRDAHNSSIEDIYKTVQRSFKDSIQMPTQDRNTLLKKFYLFPGY